MSDDRTTSAKLRDACIELVAESGTKAATARAVAERAGVSLGLIRHHFGSMGELLAACDLHVAELVRSRKAEAVAQGAGLDALGAVRATGSGHIMGYLAMRLGDDAEGINRLVDVMITDAEGYIRASVDAGMMSPSDDERARAAMLTLYALGSLSLHQHLQRHFDLDIRSTNLSAEPGFARYLRVQMEIFSGLIEPSLRDQYASAIDQLSEEDA
ncbi:TetR family transcriptional regulator [Tessaracoccus massiliensis]|uniref:TetR family transcriptional regulator n=1 Tax=Tessaracoccus massiliensis TaxID=1522311 RepID=UPI00058F1458|nr:TetR family transcriptional regulator [Tessaracoccus massiliensis]